MTRFSLRRQQAGFTIVELLLATAFFSFILLFFSFGFVQINRTFQRGQTIKRVTQTGRAVIEDLSRNIRTSSPGATQLDDSGPQKRLCLSNGVHYGWNIVTDTTPELLRDEVGATSDFSLVKSEAPRPGCFDQFVDYDGPQDVDVIDDAGNVESFVTQGITSLLDEDMVVQALSIDRIADGGALRIDLTLSTAEVATGAISNLGTADAVCDGFVGRGDEFCDVVRFTTIVNHRLP